MLETSIFKVIFFWFFFWNSTHVCSKKFFLRAKGNVAESSSSVSLTSCRGGLHYCEDAFRGDQCRHKWFPTALHKSRLVFTLLCVTLSLLTICLGDDFISAYRDPPPSIFAAACQEWYCWVIFIDMWKCLQCISLLEKTASPFSNPVSSPES